MSLCSSVIGITFNLTNMNRIANITLEPTEYNVGYRVRCYENDDLVISRIYSFLEMAQDVKRRWEWGCTVDEIE